MLYRLPNFAEWSELNDLLIESGNPRLSHNDKARQLILFVWYYRHLPRQGSDEWKKARQCVIGGSEITGLMHSRSNAPMIKKKTGVTTFEGNLATRLGNLFEPLVSGILFGILRELNMVAPGERLKKIETGSIPGMYHEGSGELIQCYSPDGLCLFTREQILALYNYPGNIRNKLCIADDAKILRSIPNLAIVLLEIKCPATRVLDGMMPRSYLHQPNLGMCTIEIADMFLYVEAALEIDSEVGSDVATGRQPGMPRHPQPTMLETHTAPEIIPGRPPTKHKYTGVIAFSGLKSTTRSDQQIRDKKDVILNMLLTRALSSEPTIQIHYYNNLAEFDAVKPDMEKKGPVYWFQWYLDAINIIPGVRDESLRAAYYKKIAGFVDELVGIIDA